MPLLEHTFDLDDSCAVVALMTRGIRHHRRVSPDPFTRTVRHLGVRLERGTDSVPDDGRYYVVYQDVVRYSSANFTLAEAHFDLLVEEVQQAHPELKNPRDVLAKEQAFRDILAIRGEGRRRARSQQETKGGKGGKGGV